MKLIRITNFTDTRLTGKIVKTFTPTTKSIPLEWLQALCEDLNGTEGRCAEIRTEKGRPVVYANVPAGFGFYE